MKKCIVVMTILALVAVLAAGCTGATSPMPTPSETPMPTLPTGMGTLEVRVTDAPGDVEAISVTVSEVRVHKAGDDEEDGVWRTLDIDEDTSFDLLELEGLELTLATEVVAAGKYTQLRMTIFEVWVTLDGEDPVEATIPSGELKFVRPFELEAGGTIALVVDFDAAESVVVTGNGKVIFKPVVKLAIEQGDKPHQLTEVEGTISAVDTEASTISIIPTGEIEAIDLDVNPQTEITLDGDPAGLGDLDGLGEGHSVTASYYIDNLKATQIDALSPPG